MTSLSAAMNGSDLLMQMTGNGLICGADGQPLGSDVTGILSQDEYVGVRRQVVQNTWMLMANLTSGPCANSSGPENASAEAGAIIGESIVVYWLKGIALAVTLTVLSLLTFVGNAMVLYAVRTERRLQTVSTLFVTSCCCFMVSSFTMAQVYKEKEKLGSKQISNSTC